MATACIDRVTSAAEIAVNQAFSGVLVVTASGCMMVFLRNRGKFPIKQRLPVLSVTFTASLVTAVVLITALANFGDSFLCSTSWITGVPILLFSFLSLTFRCFLLFVEYEAAAAIKRQMSNSGINVLSPEELTIVRIRNYFSSTKRTAVVGFLFGFFLYSPVPFISASTPANALLQSDECSGLMLKGFRYIMVVGALFVIAIIVLAYKIRKVQENFHITQELKHIGLLGIYILISYGASIGIKPIRELSMCKFRFISITSFHIPGFILLYISLVKQVIRSKNDANLKPRKSVSTTAFSSQSTNQLEAFLDLLRNTKARYLFTEFLVKEFASENILFWTETESLEREFEGDLVAFSKRIYSEYCAEDALYPINISSNCKENLEKNIGNLDDRNCTRANVKSIFALAKKEIERLMFQDAYRRFVLTPEFKALSESQHEEVQLLPVPQTGP